MNGIINDIKLNAVKRIDKTLNQMKSAPENVRFSDLAAVCAHYFGEPRQKGTSHHVYKTPWPGDPRVNIQKARNGKAKTYQVKQVLAAVKKLNEQQKKRKEQRREKGDG
nr:hypothetical protein [Hyphobacterium indicum]